MSKRIDQIVNKQNMMPILKNHICFHTYKLQSDLKRMERKY